MVYFSGLLVYSGVQLLPGILPYQIQTYLNLANYLALFGYLSLPWIRKKLKNWFLPIALAGATFIPIFSNLIYLAAPDKLDLSMLIARSWLLVPILLVPYVLTAWQYPLRYVIVLIFASTMIELFVLLPFIETVNYETVTILGVPIIRAFAFGLTGHIVSLLMDTQRGQRRELVHANVQLSEYAMALEHLTETRERNRLARELHDTLAHTLSGLAVNLEAIKITLDKNDTESIYLIDHALENTRQGLDNTRRALKSLRTKAIEEFGLLIALEKLSEQSAERGGFNLLKQLPKTLPSLNPDEELTVYRIAQEAFENVIQHAMASEVVFNITVENDHITMKIKDNGVGFSKDALFSNDVFGVRGMRERAKMVDGEFSVETIPNQSTQITLSLEVNHG